MKQLRPIENKPILLLEYISRSNTVTFRFRNEQTYQEIKDKKTSEDYYFVFEAFEARAIESSGLKAIRLPRWVIITSFGPFGWKPNGSSMDEFI